MVRNILGVIVGILVGLFVNGSLISLGHIVVPPPAGFDGTSLEGVAATIHLLEVKHLIPVFLAHAIGPLVGTFLAMLIAVSHKMKIAIGMGVFFLIGGIAASIFIPAPIWFRIVDVVFAYVPMALLGAKLGGAGKE